ncbi:MAG: SDR family oxidoreductase [Deltaproteobacteria bacterium]|nr:SDR family oxidoreductase [Deltaproteobacteria bacterium]
MAFQLSGLEGRTALVTGAGRRRGIGRTVALELAKAGCDVVVTGSGRDPSGFPADERAIGWRDVESVAEEIRGLGRRALAAVCDIASLPDVRALGERVAREMGGVDFVVNNAALVPPGRERVAVHQADPEIAARVFDVNLKGTYFMCHVFGRLLVEQARGGAIVNITSIAGKRMAPRNAAYGTSKAALHALTAALSGELGEHAIRVNGVCPGITVTSAMDEVPESAWEPMIKANIPLGRAGRPEDTAGLVLFLCSDQGAWITGQIYSVDGGQVAGR